MSIGNTPKPLFWVGSSRRDLRGFPVEVRRTFGFALWQAQNSGRHLDAKALEGLGGGVREVVEGFEGNTYRAIYTIKFSGVVYLLRLSKEVQKGREDSSARRPARQGLGSGQRRNIMMRGVPARSRRRARRDSPMIEAGSGNVFADLKVPRPREALARAELVRRITELIREQGLTQAGAAAHLGVDQPKISALLRGKTEGFSTERLFRFLNALGRDVEIIIRPVRRRRGPASTKVLTG